ncbi:MAG: hypothetical protein EXS18_02095 [Verrucomicrobiae bacterium]|nr:hypothetical protein [Verrucomicrobiae bacterium]
MSNLAQQKIHQLTGMIGSVVLMFSLVINAYFVWRNINLHREAGNKALRLQQIEVQFRDWQQLFQELIVYSNKQPALDPVLQKYRLKTSTVSSKPH